MTAPPISLYKEKRIYRFDYKYHVRDSLGETRSHFLTATSMLEAIEKFNKKFNPHVTDVINITEIPVPTNSVNKIIE